jgi:hypothetical protein
MKQMQYQVQRISMFKAGAQFENFLRPFSTIASAIVSLEGAEEKHYGYEWRILPVVSETGRSKGYVDNKKNHITGGSCLTSNTTA